MEILAQFQLDNNLSFEEMERVAQFISSKDFIEFGDYSHPPVKVQEFVESPEFLNAKGTLYPAVMDALVEANSGKYIEAVLTGAIGTGKTTIALYTTAYQLYLLSCLKNPHSKYGLDRSSEIIFIFQSVNATLAKMVDYKRFRTLIEHSSYFKENFPFDKDLESKMVFPNRIEVIPVSGLETAALGQNVMGGIIDELNFMAVTEGSKNSMDGDVYDQAVALYNSISRRRKSRFMKQGRLPGVLCLVSSKRYPGQFTDMKQEESLKELKETGKTSIFVYDKTTWDIKPEGTFTGDWFEVYKGDEIRRPRVIEPGDTVTEEEQPGIIRVPEEYRKEFEQDIMNALRDIAGVSTLTIHPFIADIQIVSEAMGRSQTVFSRPDVDFKETQLKIFPDVVTGKEYPRFAHVDLGLTGDSAGVVIGHVPRFETMWRGEETERLPVVRIDGVLEVRPPRGGEIQFHKVRDIFYALQRLGMPIRWVTFDSFQSVDSIQLLRQKGFYAGQVSMDRDNTPYEFLKSALYDRRVELPVHDRLRRELVSLEVDTKTKKIDHPPHGSKDLADALAGVVYGLTMRREIWAQHKVRIVQLPKSIQELMKKEDDKVKPG